MKTMRQMMIAVIAGSLLVLVACGDMGPEANRGTLNNALPLSPISNAATSVVFKTAFTSNTATAPVVAALQTLNAGANALPCDFTVYKINYNTVGALGEAATATAAVMVPVPTNGNSNCAGPGYPVILAAHGTDINRSSDVSKVSSHLEGSLYATIFASQGYVVIAPNYAGYDDSNLNYHPYLILNQQVKDMRDALTAAGKAGVYVGNGKLYLTGYSQGGAVALATQRALESEGVSFSASAPNSGPYAMLSFGDAIFGGQPNRVGRFLRHC
jgi:dipeptidyl aminopeptidase/acylaminoacyl peptidase